MSTMLHHTPRFSRAAVFGLIWLLVVYPARSFSNPGALSVRSKKPLNSPRRVTRPAARNPLADASTNRQAKEPSLRDDESPAKAKRRLFRRRDDMEIPDVKKVLSFAIPAIGVWLYMPLLSMMDTSIVGKLSGTAQQAALNPAIAVINYSAKLLSFLYTGTTTLVAASNEADRGRPDKPKTAKTLGGALQLSLSVGVVLGAILFTGARPFILAIMGSSEVDPAVLQPALDYVRIRSLAMPAAAVLGSAQTACLGMRDVKSPVYATVLAALVNLLANQVLVRQMGGATGAAWATVVAQYVAVAASIQWLCGPRKSTGKGFSTRGFLAGRFGLRDLFRLPSKETSRGFAPYVVPVTTTQAGRASASATLDHVVSSSLGTVSMAANQIMTSVFYGLVPLADSLSLAAQSFMPGVAEKKAGPQKAKSMKEMQKSFLKAAGLCGAVLAAVIASMPLGAKMFTSDPAVIRAVTALVPIHFAISCMHGVFTASEGMLLGQKDLGFLGRMYAIFTFLIPYLLLRIKKAALSGNKNASLTSVWQIFLGYEIARVTIMSSRVLWLQHKAKYRSKAQTTSK